MPVEVRVQHPDLYFSTQLPALNKLTDKHFDMFPSQFDKIFNVKTSTRSIEQATSVGDLGLLTEVEENLGVQYDQVSPGFPKTYTHLDYNRGYALSHNLLRDDKFALAAQHAKALGRSGKITPETLAASVFLNGFTAGAFAGPDGVALFSTAHPMESGGTQSNRPTSGVDLSIGALQNALIAMRGLRSDKGKLLMLPPDCLIIPPHLEFTAIEILGSPQKSGTANNDINAFRHLDPGYGGPFLKWKVWDYVGSAPRAWYVSANKEQTGLSWWWRERPVLLTHMEFETRAAKTAMWMAASFGFDYWQGTYGSPGGGS